MTGSVSKIPFTLGAYPNAPDGSNVGNEANFQTDFNSFTALMGTAPSYLDYFTDYTQPVSSWVSSSSWQAWSAAQTPSAAATMPVIALPMYSIAAGALSPDLQYQAIIAGQDDSVITGIVDAWAAQGFKTLAFRPGWEMNLQGYTYAGDSAQSQADWVAAFQHIYTVLHQAAAAVGVTMTVIWNPSTINYSSVQATTALYPGNAYVDAIGADAYADINPYSDTTSGAPLYHDWDTGGEDTSTAQFIADPINRAHYWSYPAATEWSNDSSGGHSLSLTSLLQFAAQQGKTFVIPETGAGNSNSGNDVADDAAFPQWLAQQLTTAQAAGTKIGFVIPWDSNSGGNYEFSNTSDNKPLEAAAWAKYFGVQPATTATTPAITTPTPTPTSTASADDTVVMAGSSGVITDGSGNAWTITSAGQVAVNGVADTTTRGVVELAYVNGTIWQENGNNLWWGETQPNASWGPSSGTVSPLPAAPTSTASANDTVVLAGSSGVIADGSGNAWTITSAGQVAVNGVADTTTRGVVELAYVNGTIWQENGNNLWWGETQPNASWGPSSGTVSPLPSTATPTPTSTSTASASDTLVMAGSSAAITDSSGNAWTITSGGQVAVNGVADTTTRGVVELAYVNGTIWQENGNNLWWGKTQPNAAWGPSSGTGSPLLGALQVTGGAGALTFIANAGSDTVTAGSGTAAVTGSTGTLTFIEGSGAATVTLSTGKGIFDFLSGAAGGSLVVNNFTPGFDVLHLQGYQGTGISSEQVSSGSAQIVLTDNTKITLTGVSDPYTHSVFG